MVDVFISYSRDNKTRVAEIAQAVKAAGYEAVSYTHLTLPTILLV